ncbi:MAG: Maf family protein [Woeseiaceae bacterium]
MSDLHLHLASASPRRKQILGALGLQFSALGVDVDEQALPGEAPQALALRLAEMKAMAAAVPAETLVLGSDTVVALGDEIFGKPVDEADCLRMLARLSGRVHDVVTAVALRRDTGVDTAVVTTKVHFREIGQDEARAYWQSGEPQDKAGAYGIQGLGGIFVKAIEGSYSCVVGLPVFETARLLADAGIEILHLRDLHD